MTQDPGSALPLIRLATPDDAPDLARMRFVFRLAHAGDRAHEDEESFVARCTAWMAARLASARTWRCWVAVRDGRIVGHAWVQFVDKVPNPVELPEQIAYFTNFFVEPGARGGTGQHLIEACLDGCREAGVERVILWPTERSRPLYLRQGFAPPEDLLQLLVHKTPESA
jgi:GNAT superfamily N-acetyltransferase